VEPRLSTATKVTLYRVCREAVNNAIKHAGASRIEVRLGCAEDGVQFGVEDNGRGFDAEQAWKTGEKGYSSLQDMYAQMAAVQGKLTVCSTPGQGTLVSGSAPAA
jgi:signal transduction histidine kinase